MTTRQDATFAQGMFVTLWPKVERCHNYVAILLAAQEKLQSTVDGLIACLQEANQAENSSLVSYADRLRYFPDRIEQLQKKLVRIHNRLVAIKESQSSRLSPSTKFTRDEVAVNDSPLF
ncbi:hypothetical protein CCR75_002686 [Bremia lactucae]|uniref:Biogenesis of lysosome-related organelles complex 1 subunit 7 n=1 Tax=Bremia lactucae TaxID=4779 RepID=A0A976IGR3_BRELC|nr:hypothetical protein CCR75_002686 [Bremia lactucae]